MINDVPLPEGVFVRTASRVRLGQVRGSEANAYGGRI